jgi:outer membrane biosynthesis protein TonB
VITWPRWTNLAVLLLCTTVFANSIHCLAQEDSPAGSRRVINKVAPQYPAWARSMNLQGIVKVEALVGSNGVGKTVGVKGGHPVLVQSATDAVRKMEMGARFA